MYIATFLFRTRIFRYRNALKVLIIQMQPIPLLIKETNNKAIQREICAEKPCPVTLRRGRKRRIDLRRMLADFCYIDSGNQLFFRRVNFESCLIFV